MLHLDKDSFLCPQNLWFSIICPVCLSFLKTINLNFGPLEMPISYFSCVFLLSQPFQLCNGCKGCNLTFLRDLWVIPIWNFWQICQLVAFMFFKHILLVLYLFQICTGFISTSSYYIMSLSSYIACILLW